MVASMVLIKMKKNFSLKAQNVTAPPFLGGEFMTYDHKLTPEEARLTLKKQKGVSGRSNRIERKCELCEVVTNDMSKHLERVHKLNKEERWKYIHKARAQVPIHWKNSSQEQKGKNCPLCEGKHYAKLKRHLIDIHKLTLEEARLTLKKQKGISGDPPGIEHSHDIGDSPGKEDYYDKVNPPGKEHSHDKGEPPGKEHSHDKGDSPGKEDSHDKGDSPGKEHSHDKGDPPGKEHSHDKGEPPGKEDPPEEEGHSEQEEPSEKKDPPEKDFSTTAKATGRCNRIQRKCEFCEVVTNDMSKHLERVHKLNKEERWKYIHKARARVPIHWKNSSGERKGRNCPLCEGKHYAKLKRHLIDIHKLTPEKAMVTLKRQEGISGTEKSSGEIYHLFKSYAEFTSSDSEKEKTSKHHLENFNSLVEVAGGSLQKLFSDQTVFYSVFKTLKDIHRPELLESYMSTLKLLCDMLIIEHEDLQEFDVTVKQLARMKHLACKASCNL